MAGGTDNRARGWWVVCKNCGVPFKADGHTTTASVPGGGRAGRHCPHCPDPELAFWDDYAILGEVGPAVCLEPRS